MATCSRCARAKEKIPCVFAEGSSKCSECIRKARSCDGPFSGDQFDRLEEEMKRLERERRASLAIAAQKLQEVMSLEQRVESLRQQQSQMIKRGVAVVEWRRRTMTRRLSIKGRRHPTPNSITFPERDPQKEGSPSHVRAITATGRYLQKTKGCTSPIPVNIPLPAWPPSNNSSNNSKG